MLGLRSLQGSPRKGWRQFCEMLSKPGGRDSGASMLFILHEVTPTDTLQGLAIRYDVDMDLLYCCNSMMSDQHLQHRQHVYIPLVHEEERLEWGCKSAFFFCLFRPTLYLNVEERAVYTACRKPTKSSLPSWKNPLLPSPCRWIGKTAKLIPDVYLNREYIVVRSVLLAKQEKKQVEVIWNNPNTVRQNSSGRWKKKREPRDRSLTSSHVFSRSTKEPKIRRPNPLHKISVEPKKDGIELVPGASHPTFPRSPNFLICVVQNVGCCSSDILQRASLPSSITLLR